MPSAPHFTAKRWMYRGGHPHRLARWMNRFGTVLNSGSFSPAHWVTVEVPGRRTGRIITFPAVIAEHEGRRYLVSMLGGDATWVRNVRAADGRIILRKHGRRAVRLREVPAAARAPILRRYLDVAPGARPHFPVDRHAPEEDFDRIAERYPVFRLDPWREASHPP